MLREQKTGKITSEGIVLSQFTNTSFPQNKDAVFWNNMGYDIIYEGTKPSHDILTQVLLDDGIEELTENGEKKWYTKYKVADKFSDIEGGKTKKQQEDDLVAQINENQAKSNRGRRDSLLFETDWWASSDLTMTSEQIQYRKALRDLPEHSSWPNLKDSDWPTKP